MCCKMTTNRGVAQISWEKRHSGLYRQDVGGRTRCRDGTRVGSMKTARLTLPNGRIADTASLKTKLFLSTKKWHACARTQTFTVYLWMSGNIHAKNILGRIEFSPTDISYETCFRLRYTAYENISTWSILFENYSGRKYYPEMYFRRKYFVRNVFH